MSTGRKVLFTLGISAALLLLTALLDLPAALDFAAALDHTKIAFGIGILSLVLSAAVIALFLIVGSIKSQQSGG